MVGIVGIVFGLKVRIDGVVFGKCVGILFGSGKVLFDFFKIGFDEW